MKNHSLFKLFFLFIAVINLFFISMAYSKPTIPDIKINNLYGHLRFIRSEENLSVFVQLDPADRSENADWFVAANTPLGIFFYTLQGWTNLISPVVQTALRPLPKTNLMNFPASALPSGEYALYFAVDTEMDGAITWEQLDVDVVEFTILESSLPKDRRFIEASAGGTLNVTNTRGDEISLKLPPGSLKESSNITMTALNSSVSSPFTNELLPGIVLSPQGLILEQPARIKVKFATPLTEAKSSALFLVKGPKVALPLVDRAYNSNELEADIFHFSTIDAAVITSEAEILNAINEVVHQSREGAGWHDTYATVRSLLEFQKIAQGLGYEDADNRAWEAAQSITSTECADFLAEPVPKEPCGTYKKSFNNLIQLVQLFGLENCSNENHYISYDYIQELIISLGNQCVNKKIAGNWHFKPSSKFQQCKYFDIVFPDEKLDFPIYDIQISFPRSWDSNYIVAPVTENFVMTGSWNGDSRKFDLSANTSDISKCGNLYYTYYDTLCEDAINCTLISCNIRLELNDGKATDSDVTSLEADAYWSYSITTEVGYAGLRNQVPWVCEGSALFSGSRIR